MRVVAALGGNALQPRGETATPALRQHHLEAAARSLAALAQEHRLVVTHGNGPQVGTLALAATGGTAETLDVLVAESQGMIGYLLAAAVGVALPGRDIVSVLTQVEVDAADPGFAAPSKPIGPLYNEAEARLLAAERAWTMMRDGTAFRRAVASPAPLRICELTSIRLLAEAGAIVICAGGGGIPVTVAPDGSRWGIEAVIDKDLTAALLAEQLGADALLLLTDVPAAATHWGETGRRWIARATPRELRNFHFAAGSMGPKVVAACRFVERTGRMAAIGALDEAPLVLAGAAGTLIRDGGNGVAYHA